MDGQMHSTHSHSGSEGPLMSLSRLRAATRADRGHRALSGARRRDRAGSVWGACQVAARIFEEHHTGNRHHTIGAAQAAGDHQPGARAAPQTVRPRAASGTLRACVLRTGDGYLQPEMLEGEEHGELGRAASQSLGPKWPEQWVRMVLVGAVGGKGHSDLWQETPEDRSGGDACTAAKLG